MSDVLANFSCLDELTQVIYQSVYKFVVLSSVSSDKWNIHVGLSGREGRWWHGRWTEDDIHRIFVCVASFRWLKTPLWSLSADSPILTGLKIVGQTA